MQKLQLSIPEPCHENWQDMTATEQGRFCNACVKEVVDFSMMTDTEILNYFSAITHQKVCGRALPSQLERNISYPKQPKKRLFWYWNYIVMFFMFFGKANSAKAQGGIKIVNQTEVTNTPVSNYRGEMVTTKAICTKRSDKKPIVGPETRVRLGGMVSINANNTPLYVVDGEISNSKVDVNPDEIDEIFVLQAPDATALFGPQGSNGAIVINRKLKVKTIDTVTVSSGIALKGRLGGMMYTSVRTNYFSDVNANITTILNDSLKVFPNPVQKNSIVNFSMKLKEPGKFSLMITDAAGRMIAQKQFEANAKTHIEQLNTENWSSGMYYIRVFDARNKLISKNSFIVR